MRPCPGELASNASADGFVSTSGLRFESCASEHVDERAACCGPRTAGYECLVAALRACEPARFAESRGTIEGDPIFFDYFVVRAEDGEGCRLMVMTDNRQDAFRDPTGAPVHTRSCGSATVSAEPGEECPRLVLSDCSP